MKHPEHICRLNDPPQSCDCYDTGFEAGKREAKEEAFSKASKEISSLHVLARNAYQKDSWDDGFHEALFAANKGIIRFIKNLRKTQP